MYFNKNTTFWLSFLLLMITFPIVALGANIQMKFMHSKGKVQILRAGKAYIYNWNQVPEQGLKLAIGDKLRIGSNTTIGIKFLDTGDHILLYANSLFVVSQIKKEKSIVDLWLGKAKFFVKKSLTTTKQRFQVRTRGSIIGVKGTEFLVNTANKETAVVCIEGEIELKSEQFPTVGVSIKANQMSLAVQGEKPRPSVALSQESVQNIEKAWSEDKPVDVKKTYQDAPVVAESIQSSTEQEKEEQSQEEIQQSEKEEQPQEETQSGNANNQEASIQQAPGTADIPQVEEVKPTPKTEEDKPTESPQKTDTPKVEKVKLTPPKIPETPKVKIVPPKKKEIKIKIKIN